MSIVLSMECRSTKARGWMISIFPLGIWRTADGFFVSTDTSSDPRSILRGSYPSNIEFSSEPSNGSKFIKSRSGINRNIHADPDVAKHKNWFSDEIVKEDMVSATWKSLQYNRALDDMPITSRLWWSKSFVWRWHWIHGQGSSRLSMVHGTSLPPIVSSTGSSVR